MHLVLTEWDVVSVWTLVWHTKSPCILYQREEANITCARHWTITRRWTIARLQSIVRLAGSPFAIIVHGDLTVMALVAVSWAIDSLYSLGEYLKTPSLPARSLFLSTIAISTCPLHMARDSIPYRSSRMARYRPYPGVRAPRHRSDSFMVRGSLPRCSLILPTFSFLSFSYFLHRHPLAIRTTIWPPGRPRPPPSRFQAWLLW